MLARIELEYAVRKLIKQLTPEDYTELRTVLEDWPDVQDKDDYYYGQDHLVDLTEAGPVLDKLKIKYTVKRFKGQVSLGGPLQSLAGQPVHVHIPNIGLLSVTSVTWLENCCTEELQRHLNSGWRILAVCPPNCQRRPDYILGRAKEA